MSDFFNFLNFSIIVFIFGVISCGVAIVYSLVKTKISKIVFNYICIIPCISFTILLTLALFLKNLSVLQYMLGLLGGNLTFLTLFIFYFFIPKKIYKQVDLSCGEEWLNLSYILGLIEKVSRFDIPLLEQEFFNAFKQKIHRMTTYNCYEAPSSFELSRFYFLCERLGVK
ncbi:MAG: hypothetical protein J6C97_02645 [Clostridia bacterium]|nr:hypothetical protein [Clostridia bacterium]